MPKNLLFIITLVVIGITAYLTLIINSSLSTVSKNEIETAVNQSQVLYKSKVQRGEDLSNGPCLSDALLPGWVLDIAHNPRIAIDDLPENQCSSFREGRTKHFVELDLQGKLIRAK